MNNKLYFLNPDFFILDDPDKTELMWSIIDNNIDLFKLLLEKEEPDWDIGKHTKMERSPLHYAVFYNRYDMIKILCDKHALISHRDINGVSPALLAAKMGNLPALKLFDDGSTVKSDCNRTQAGSYAAAYRQNEVLRFLCNTGVFQTKDDFGYNVAHYAALVGNVEAIKIIKKYRQYGSDGFDEQDNDGRTPFMNAILNGNIEFVKTMLDFGWRDKYEYSNYQHQKGDLITDNNNMCALQLASISGNYDIVELLVNDGKFDIKRKNKDGKTAALLAAEVGNITTLNYLVSRTNPLDTDNQGNNILIYAVCGGNIFMVKYLVKEMKVNINFRNHKNQTALTLATMLYYDEIKQFLIDNGGDI